jgi:hypothetical protein
VKVNARLAELLVQNLQNLPATSYVRYEGGPTPAEGLDVKKGAVEIEVALDTKETVTLTIGAATKDGDSEGYFAASNKQKGAVFTIGKGIGDIFEEIKKKSEALIAP